MQRRSDGKRKFDRGFIAVLFLPACWLLFLLFIKICDYRIDKTKTGLLKDGSLRIVYPYDMGGGYFNYFVTDEGVIAKKEAALVGRSGGKQGAIFSPVSAGEADIYTVWLENPSSDDYRAEVFHVTVDGALKISYTNKEIGLERYREVSGRDDPRRWDELNTK